MESPTLLDYFESDHLFSMQASLILEGLNIQMIQIPLDWEKWIKISCTQTLIVMLMNGYFFLSWIEGFHEIKRKIIKIKSK